MALNPPHRVSVLRAPLMGTRHGPSQKRDWSAAVVVAADVPAWVQPQRGQGTSGSETTLVADTQVELRDCYLFPVGVLEVVGTDRVVWAGDTFEVAAPPEEWKSDGGALDHLLVALKRVTSPGG